MNFFVYADLKPEGSVTIPFCHKIYEKIPYERVMDIAKERQGDTGKHAILKIKNDIYCIPEIENQRLPQGACQCAINNFLDNCRSKICIINPKEKRIV